MRYLDRLRAGGWTGVAVYLVIAVGTLGVLSYLLKKSDRTHLTKGALMVMLMYLAVGAFMLLASRVFVTKREDSQ
jgi:undecaprenyl pyrophosphate phosphatase UppP